MKKWLIPFVVISVLELIGRIGGLDLLTQITKPLLMPTLLFYVYKECPAYPLKMFLKIALVLSFLGDVMLMLVERNDTFFLLGLSSFLLAHLLYAFMFFNTTDVVERKFKAQWQDLIFVAYGLFMFSFIKDDLGSMYFPAMVYAIVISLMAITARKRWKKTDSQSFWLVMSGAACFVISDSILAIDKFTSPFEQAGFAIMLTYLIGQFLIAQGLIVYLQKIPLKTGSDS